MASKHCPPPIKPFCQLRDEAPRPEQTLYTISKEDQERLAPYLPPKRDEFLIEGPILTGCLILPKDGQSYEVLNTFTERLKTETDQITLRIHPRRGNGPAHWYQTLTPEQVDIYQNDPAVYLSCSFGNGLN
jgi:hypothetical protein